MVLQEKNIKRLVIYFIYDKQGIVDDYILYMLKAIKETGSEIEVVCNGKLTPDSREKISQITSGIMVRENRGFDVWAYKSVLDYYGWEKLETYDEIIMMNFTIMGPVYPLQEMFHTMNQKDLDFWGITKYHLYEEADPFGTIEYGYIPEHIQSHFIAVRNPMIKSIEFQSYWDSMRKIHNYQEAIGFHEAIFTKKFAEAGFVYDVYADLEEKYNNHPILCATTRMLKEKRCPIFKRRSFMQEYSNILHDTFGQEAPDTLQFLKENTDYDTEMIWDNILRVENIADIKKNMQLNYIINHDGAQSRVLQEHKSAVWLGITHEKRIADYLDYLDNLPKEIDLILVPSTEDLKQKLENKCVERQNCTILDCGKTALETALVFEKERIKTYEYNCFMQDIEIDNSVPYSSGASFLYKQFSNLLSQGNYVSKIIELFEKENRLGLLVSPPSSHGNYYSAIGNAWGYSYDKSLELAKKMDIEVPISFAKEPILADENMFWVRTAAWKNILDYEFSSKDFEKKEEQEKEKEEDSLSGVLMRMHAYAVQQQGYYSAWLMSEKAATIEMTNESYIIEEFNKVALQMGILQKSREEVMHLTKNALQDWYDYIADGSKYYRRTKLYVNEDGGYEEDKICSLRWDEEQSCYYTEDVGEFSSVEELRWDPGERSGIMIQNFKCIIMDVFETKYEIDLNQIVTNGVCRDGKIYFLKKDPQIYLKLPQKLQVKELYIYADIIDEIPYEEAAKLGNQHKFRDFLRKIKNKLKKMLRG